MSNSEYDSIKSGDFSSSERGKSKLVSPNPQRMKYVTEMLHAFGNRKISFAGLVGLSQKKVKQVAEMGYVKLSHGRFEEARKIFEILTFIDHKNPFHHLALAGAYHKLKKNVDALFQYSEAIKLDPKNLNAYVNRGEVYLRCKNYRKAAEDFREAILLDEKGKDRFSNRARSLVVAIKRSMQRDKELSVSGQLPSARPAKPVISPMRLVRPRKK